MKDFTDASPEEQFPANESLLTDEQPLPKAYDDALQRVTQVLESQEPVTVTEKLLFGIGLFLCALLLCAQLLHWLAYPKWLEVLYSFAIFAEAALPLTISFFLKNRQQALILRIVGSLVLLLYALSLFS